MDVIGPYEVLSRLKGCKIIFAAKMIQLSMEYDPQPPFDCGSPDKAPLEILEKMANK